MDRKQSLYRVIMLEFWHDTVVRDRGLGGRCVINMIIGLFNRRGTRAASRETRPAAVLAHTA